MTPFNSNRLRRLVDEANNREADALSVDSNGDGAMTFGGGPELVVTLDPAFAARETNHCRAFFALHERVKAAFAKTLPGRVK
ncbi:MAG: hypothetical protein ABL984_00490 [Pyrinomonadaceae bacterium]